MSWLVDPDQCERGDSRAGVFTKPLFESPGGSLHGGSKRGGFLHARNSRPSQPLHRISIAAVGITAKYVTLIFTTDAPCRGFSPPGSLYAVRQRQMWFQERVEDFRSLSNYHRAIPGCLSLSQKSIIAWVSNAIRILIIVRMRTMHGTGN